MQTKDEPLFDAIRISGDMKKVEFGRLTRKSSSEVSALLGKRSFDIQGLFVHFSDDAFDWVLVATEGNDVKKLQRPDAAGYLKWQILNGGSKETFESVRYNPERGMLEFGPKK